MTIIEKVRQRIFESRFGSEERYFLRGILGELARNNQQESGGYFIKQWIKKNEEQGRRTRRNVKEAERIAFETNILKSLLEE